MNIKTMNFIDRMLKNRAEKSLHPRHIMNISLFLSVIMVFSTFANNNVYSQVEISLDVEGSTNYKYIG